MQKRRECDFATVTAIGVVAYVLANLVHEVAGHCGAILPLGGHCYFVSSTDVRIAPELAVESWAFRLDAMAGSVANWIVGLLALAALRGSRTRGGSARYFFWIAGSVNVLLPSTYMFVGPLIRFGDWYSLTIGMPNASFWRTVVTVAGGIACWRFFVLCRAELLRLVEGAPGDRRQIARALTWLPYFAGSAVVVLSGLVGPLEWKWAVFVAAGGTLGLTWWIPLMSWRMAPENMSHPPFVIPRSAAWIVAGACLAILFILLMGPGIRLRI